MVIGKITSKSIRLQLVFRQKIEVNREQIFTVEKMRKSGNCIYDYDHSFQCIFFNPMRCTANVHI